MNKRTAMLLLFLGACTATWAEPPTGVTPNLIGRGTYNAFNVHGDPRVVEFLAQANRRRGPRARRSCPRAGDFPPRAKGVEVDRSNAPRKAVLAAGTPPHAACSSPPPSEFRWANHCSPLVVARPHACAGIHARVCLRQA